MRRKLKRFVRRLILLPEKATSNALAKAILYASCVYFHQRLKQPGYPRSLREDLHRSHKIMRNRFVVRSSTNIRHFICPCSDPLWLGASDHIYDPALSIAFQREDPLFLQERGLSGVWRLLLVVVFGSYLKKLGDVISAENFYQTCLADDALRVEALLGLADLTHCLAGWRAELEEYRERGIYPDPPLLTKRDVREALPNLHRYDFGRAIDLYRRAIAARPESVFARLHLGRALMQVGDIEASYAVYAEAAKLQPANRIVQIAHAYAAVIVRKRNSKQLYKSAISGAQGPLQGQPDAVSVQVLTTIEAARQCDVDVIELASPDKLTGSCEVFQDGGIHRHNFSISFEPAVAAKFDQIRDIGVGLKVIGDRYLLSDSRGLNSRQAKLFAPKVIVSNDTRALVLKAAGKIKAEGKYAPILLPGSSFNYYHWLMDSLGSLLLLEDHLDLGKHPIITAYPIRPYQDEAVEMLFGRKLQIEYAPDLKNSVFESAFHVQYPARCSVPHPEVVRRLRSRLSKHKANATPGRRVYLTRKSLLGRKSVEEESIERALTSRGFEICDPAALSFAGQIAYFSDVEILVAASGAALTNLLFCPQDTKVISVQSALQHSETFTAISSAIGQKQILCVGPSQTYLVPYFVWSTFDYRVEVKDVLSCLDYCTANKEIRRRH